jgi:SprT protein
MLVAELQAMVVVRVEDCLNLASRHFQRDFPLPEINFKQRGKIAGCARLQTNQLRFNPVLLADNLEIFLNEVVPHEVCHLLAHQLYGRVKPHGNEWKTLMSELFNLKATTKHSMDVSKVQGESFEYLCKCGSVTLSIRRHNKVLRNKQNYICRRCNQILVQARH